MKASLKSKSRSNSKSNTLRNLRSQIQQTKIKDKEFCPEQSEGQTQRTLGTQNQAAESEVGRSLKIVNIKEAD